VTTFHATTAVLAGETAIVTGAGQGYELLDIL
jgi:hypothetical protein